MQADSPQLEIQVRNEAAQFADGLYEVAVTVTVTARAGEKTCFLAEVAQAGIFAVRGIAAEDLEPLLAIGCPTILYPYAREAISDLVTRAGFPAGGAAAGFLRADVHAAPAAGAGGAPASNWRNEAAWLPAFARRLWRRARRSSARCRRTPPCCTTRPRARRRRSSWSSATIRSK